MKNNFGRKLIGVTLVVLFTPLLIAVWMGNPYSIKDTFNDFYLDMSTMNNKQI